MPRHSGISSSGCAGTCRAGRYRTTVYPLVVHELKRPFRDGTTQCLFKQLKFLARLAALIPRPQSYLVRYHGAFAPKARQRALLVGKPGVRTPTAAEEPEARTYRAAMT